MRDAQRDAEFEAIVRRTQVRIRAYIAGMGIAAHEVDDLAQDVFLEFYRNMEKKPEEVIPERWLKGIARNVCLNHIRRSARRARLHREALAEMLANLKDGSDQLASAGPVQFALEGCFDKLPEDSRKLLSMRYKQELNSKAIASALDSTAEAIRVALYRIRSHLRDCVTHSLAREKSP